MTTFYCNNIADSLRVNVSTGAYVLLTPSQETTDGTNINVNPSVKIPIIIGYGVASFSQSVVDCQTQLPHFLYTVQIFSQGALVYNQTGVAITGASYNLASFIPGSQGGTSGVTVPTLQTNGTNNTDQLILNLKQGSNITLSADGAGGVTINAPPAGDTSVGLVDSTGTFVVTNSPITSAGNLTLSAFATQSAKTFLAAPNFFDGAPSFRLIVAGDIPAIAESGVTGLVSDLAAKAPLAAPVLTGFVQLGGSASVNSATDPGAGYLNVGAGFRIADSSAASGHYLRGNGAHYVDGTIQAGDVPTLNQNTTGTSGGLTGTPNISVGTITASGLITGQANIQLGIAGTTSGVVTLEGSTSGSCTITAPATAGTAANAITFSNSIQIPSGTAYNWNADLFLSRMGANSLGVGNAIGASNGALSAGGITCGGTTTTASLSVTGATATFGTAGATSGVITLEGSASGSCTITAPATAGTIANPIAFSNSINLPSATSIGWNADTFLYRHIGGTVYVGNGAGNALGIVAASSFQAGTNGTVSGSVALFGSTSGSCTMFAPAVAGTTSNPIAFSNALTSQGTPVTVTVASGTATLGTSAIASGATATIVTVSAPGVLATDNIQADFSVDPSAVTGFAPSASGMLTIIKFCNIGGSPAGGQVNFYVYNNTASSITPGTIGSPPTGMILNWRVTR